MPCYMKFVETVLKLWSSESFAIVLGLPNNGVQYVYTRCRDVVVITQLQSGITKQKMCNAY